jgi:hypothetical protein
METLSDAVNQLILLVIALQEQNSAMPPHIPPATVSVNQFYLALFNAFLLFFFSFFFLLYRKQ